MIERTLRDYAARLRTCAVPRLRYFNAAGADPEGDIGEDHDPETHLIPLVSMPLPASVRRSTVFGDDYDTPDGTCIRDYIHVTDLADAHVRALEYLDKHEGFDAFNLGNGNGFSVSEVIETASRVTGISIPTRIVGRRPGDPPSLVGDADKARRELGWQPRYADLDTIVETAWRWERQ